MAADGPQVTCKALSLAYWRKEGELLSRVVPLPSIDKNSIEVRILLMLSCICIDHILNKGSPDSQ